MTTTTPFVSIVTPIYNGSAYIEYAIHNVADQGVTALEHIVIDGGSKDGTVEILKRYPDVRWLSERDTGQSNALNKGFRMAQGEIIGWLNGDDSYTPGAITSAVGYLARNPACDVVYGDCNILDAQGALIRVFRPAPAEGVESLAGSFIHTPAVFWRRRVFQRVGYLDEKLHYCMDNEFWIRMAPVVRRDYLPSPLANYKLRPGSKGTTTKAEFGTEMCAIYETLFVQEPFKSGVSESTKGEILRGHYWAAGIELCREDQVERAKPFLRSALDHYNILAHPQIALSALLVDYETQHLHGFAATKGLVQRLPIREPERERLMDLLSAEYDRVGFFLSHKESRRSQARVFGLRHLQRHPYDILNRGFASCLLEDFIGSRLMRFVRSRG